MKRAGKKDVMTIKEFLAGMGHFHIHEFNGTVISAHVPIPTYHSHCGAVIEQGNSIYPLRFRGECATSFSDEYRTVAPFFLAGACLKIEGVGRFEFGAGQIDQSINLEIVFIGPISAADESIFGWLREWAQKEGPVSDWPCPPGHTFSTLHLSAGPRGACNEANYAPLRDAIKSWK